MSDSIEAYRSLKTSRAQSTLRWIARRIRRRERWWIAGAGFRHESVATYGARVVYGRSSRARPFPPIPEWQALGYFVDAFLGRQAGKSEAPGRWSRFNFRRPQCVSLRSGLNTRSTFRLRACITPMRANIVGPPSVTTSNSASIAACHSSASCSALGSLVM
jgi:hypothetical protein